MSTRRMRYLSVRHRIRVALLKNYGEVLTYHAVMYLTFPHDMFPNALRHRPDGGPPGCAMAFGRALARMRKDKLVTEVLLGKSAVNSAMGYRLTELGRSRPELCGKEVVWVTAKNY